MISLPEPRGFWGEKARIWAVFHRDAFIPGERSFGVKKAHFGAVLHCNGRHLEGRIPV